MSRPYRVRVPNALRAERNDAEASPRDPMLDSTRIIALCQKLSRDMVNGPQDDPPEAA
jgi:hypothetical protein